MKLFGRMWLIVIWGGLLHLTYYPTEPLPTRVRNLLRNTIGTVGMLPPLIMFYNLLRPTGQARDHEAEQRLTMAYSLTALCVGCGVAGAYMIDTALEARRWKAE